MNRDLFSEKLLEASFRGIPFPVTDFRMSISQDIVQHKRPDQDGARVEATGRNPITFTATIPFIVGIAQGPNEDWGLSVPLYPERHRAFLTAMADRTVGELQHPSFGKLDVKPVNCSSELTADRRGGETVQAEWIEATDYETDSDGLFKRDPAIEGLWAATALDKLLDSIPLIKKADPDPRISISEAFNRVVAVFDTASLLVRRGLATIDQLAYRINTLHRAVVGLADPKTWQVRDKLERLSSSLEKMRRLGMGQSGNFTYYVVPSKITVAELAASFNVSVSELINLNPFLLRRVTVERGEVVRRFKRVNMNGGNEITPQQQQYGRPSG